MKNFDNKECWVGSTKGKLLIVRGIPGSGKTTFCKRFPNGVYIALEADMYFARMGIYEFNAEFLKHAHSWCLNTAQVLLSQGHSVIVANTFTKYDELSKYVDYAKRFGHTIEVVTMNGNFGSVHEVPEETMTKMRERFESHKSIIEKINAN